MQTYLTVAVTVAVLFGMIAVGSVAAQEAIEVEDADGLVVASDRTDGDYVLVDDVDLSSENVRIGDADEPFTGTFDGNDHSVTGMSAERRDNLGLFGVVGDDGVVENLRVEGEVSGDASVGLLAGRNEGIIRQSHSSGSVEGERNVGGLVGTNLGELRLSHSSADADGNLYTGGLAGRNAGDIDESYATGDVEGGSNAGGLVGYNLGEVSASYATGEVLADVTAGGLVGHNRGRALVTESYAVGKVDAESEASALVALSSADEERSYYDSRTTGEDARFEYGLEDPPGTPLTTEEMTDSDAERNMRSLDFENTWATTDGYPRHVWDVRAATDTDGLDRDDSTVTGDDEPDTELDPDQQTAHDAQTEAEGGTEEGTDSVTLTPEELPGFTAVAALAALLSVLALRLAD